MARSIYGHSHAPIQSEARIWSTPHLPTGGGSDWAALKNPGLTGINSENLRTNPAYNPSSSSNASRNNPNAKTP